MKPLVLTTLILALVLVVGLSTVLALKWKQVGIFGPTRQHTVPLPPGAKHSHVQWSDLYASSDAQGHAWQDTFDATVLTADKTALVGEGQRIGVVVKQMVHPTTHATVAFHGPRAGQWSTGQWYWNTPEEVAGNVALCQQDPPFVHTFPWPTKWEWEWNDETEQWALV